MALPPIQLYSSKIPGFMGKLSKLTIHSSLLSNYKYKYEFSIYFHLTFNMEIKILSFFFLP